MSFNMDSLQRDKLHHLLQVAEFYEKMGRPIPGHIRTAIVSLAPYWKGITIPQAVQQAKAVLRPYVAQDGSG